jgi:sugar lactone lactonase YvrE
MLCRSRLFGATAIGLVTAACSGSASSSPGFITQPPVPSATAPTGLPSASAPASTVSSSPSASLAGCHAAVAFSSLAPVATEPVDVDDATVTSDGHIWLTAVDAGRVLELDATGRLLRSIDDPRGPEGIAPLPGGALALAEQKANRVVRLDPATGGVEDLLDVPNHTQNEGVDGLAFDAASSRLLVPDSANGRLLSVAVGADGRATGSLTVLASALGRPVAAWPESSGAVLVGVENSPGVLRVAPGGAVSSVVPPGTLTEVDEVLGEGAWLYVTDLTRRVLAAVDPAAGAVHDLVTGAADPQGLALLPDGRLLLVDSTTRTLVAVPACT